MQIHTHLHGGGLRAKIAQLHSRLCCRRQCIPTDPSLSKSAGTYCLGDGLLELCIYLLLLGAFLSSNAQKPLVVHCLAVLAWSGLSIINSKRIWISAEAACVFYDDLEPGAKSWIHVPAHIHITGYYELFPYLYGTPINRNRDGWISTLAMHSLKKNKKIIYFEDVWRVKICYIYWQHWQKGRILNSALYDLNKFLKLFRHLYVAPADRD